MQTALLMLGQGLGKAAALGPLWEQAVEPQTPATCTTATFSSMSLPPEHRQEMACGYYGDI